MHGGRGSTVNLIIVCAYTCSMTPKIIYIRCYSLQQSTLWFGSQRTPQLVEGENPINFSPVDTPVGGIVWHQMRQTNTRSMWALRCWSIYHNARLNDDAWGHYTCRRALTGSLTGALWGAISLSVCGQIRHKARWSWKNEQWRRGHGSSSMLSSIFFLPQSGSNLKVLFTQLYWQYIKMLENNISFA